MAAFVCITREYQSNGYIIKENEIGIVEGKKGTTSSVQFANCPILIEIPNELLKSFVPQETGDQFSHKICNRCNRLLPIDNFQKNQNGKNNRTVRRPSCNECRNLIDGKNVPDAIRKKWEKKKPNMVIWECPICKKRTIPGITSKVVLDHNHKTGMPNAWICDSCNTGLGRFKDDISVMKEAIRYLKKHQK